MLGEMRCGGARQKADAAAPTSALAETTPARWISPQGFGRKSTQSPSRKRTLKLVAEQSAGFGSDDHHVLHPQSDRDWFATPASTWPIVTSRCAIGCAGDIEPAILWRHYSMVERGYHFGPVTQYLASFANLATHSRSHIENRYPNRLAIWRARYLRLPPIPCTRSDNCFAEAA